MTAITHRLVQAGEIIGIRLLDHLILGSDNDYISFKASCLMDTATETCNTDNIEQMQPL
ncbi:JAB domain-containing protein [Cohnella sp.]|uniref:JAB domain-containing protein n=1 Tax=Cohnella sp. TaxID=1883426 RepID=UPI00257FF097|nr:JAB domain-containing protein [Cohnella sp.]